MSLRIILSTLLASFILSACQVKETNSSGDLISGHTPTTNKFTLQTPIADTYTNGDVIAIKLTFPFHVTVTGTPQLSLTVGAAARTANYASGDGSSTLTFEYPVVAADNDSDGIRVNSIGLNGGTLTFLKDALPVNCDLTLTAKTFPLVLVDNTAPTITAFALTTPPGFYHLGQKITFHVTYSEAVHVTGVPRIALGFDVGANGFATYAGGTGTTVLSFEYTILAVNADLTGYAFPTPSIANGTITDSSGIAAAASLAAFTAPVVTASNFVEFSGAVPYVVSVTPPANGTYVSNVNLDFVVEFDQNVTVSAGNYLELAFTSGIKQANYFSGTGTKIITFRYTTIPGDADADGIVINRIFGGTITGGGNFYTGTDFLNNVFYPATQTGIILNSPLPQVTAVSILNDTSPNLNIVPSAPDGVFIIGETMDIVVNFNVIVKVVQTIGTPYIDVTIGATVVRAYYLSGDGQTSLVFRYTILEGQSDTDGVALASAITLNGGTITDQAITNAQLTLTTTAFPARRVDGIRPVISSVAAPANGTYSTVTTPNYLDFNVNWSEAVQYSNTASVSIPVDIGGVSSPAGYNANNNTASVRHRYTIQANRIDTDGITLSSPITLTAPARIRDLAGNDAAVITYTLPNTTAVLVDAVVPTIVSVTAPPAGRYRTGDNLDFTATFSESITIAGSPRFSLIIGAQTRNVTNLTPGTGTVFTFRYVVQATDTGAVSFPTTPTIALNGGTMRDTGLNAVAPLTFTGPTVSGIIIDEVAPTISTAASTAGTYVSAGGSTSIVFDVTFSENVTVTGGAPYIEFTAATGTIRADYSPGTSTALIKRFTYTVLGTDLDLNGLTALSTSVELNGATFQDALANDAVLTLPAVSNLSTTIIAPHLNVWIRGSTANLSGLAGRPTVSTTAALAGGYYSFNGSSTLSISAPGTMEHVFMAIRAPLAADAYPQTFIAGMDLENALAEPTIDITDGRVSSFDNSTGTTSLSDALVAGNRQQVELVYPPATGRAAAFIPAGYTGSVAEILIFNASLSGAQRAHVMSYLNSYGTGP